MKQKNTAFLLVLGFLLAGCTKAKPVYEDVANNAIDTITAIEHGLPKECKTDANALLFNVSRKEIKNITNSCNEAVDKVNQEKLRWKWSFWGLTIFIVMFFLRKILK